MCVDDTEPILELQQALKGKRRRKNRKAIYDIIRMMIMSLMLTGNTLWK